MVYFAIGLFCVLIDVGTVLGLNIRALRRGGSTSFGRTFVLALPGMEIDTGQMLLYTSTLEYEDVFVNVTSEWKDPKEQYNFKISRHSYKSQLLSGVYSSLRNLEARWTYHVEATHPIQVYVTVQMSNRSFVSNLMLLPLEGWGMYYLISTTNFRSSFQVVNGPIFQKVRLVLVIRDGNAKCENECLNQFNTTYAELRSYEGFSVQWCAPEKNIGDLSGSHVEGALAIGIIVGSCLLKTERVAHDIATDMLLPVTDYCVQYIVFKPHGALGYIAVMNLYSDTNFTVSTQEKTEMYTTSFLSTIIKIMNLASVPNLRQHEKGGDSGEVVNIERLNFPGIVKSTQSLKPIIVTLFLTSTRTYEGSKWQYALSVIVPTGLLMDNYYWSTYDDNIIHYVVVLFRGKQSLYIYKDGASIQRQETWKGQTSGVVNLGQFKVPIGEHYIYSMNSFRYAVYLFGKKGEYTYVSPAGFISNPGEAIMCGLLGSEGDLIDNDCDGFVDEEKRDEIDNDGDGKIDEDVGKTALMDGVWSAWSDWQCEGQMFDKMHRKRFCNNPAPNNGGMCCPGPQDEYKEANCHELQVLVVDGGWFESQYECIDCLTGGSRARITRECSNPRPRNGGKDCQGSTVIEEENYHICASKCAPHTATTTTSDIATTQTTTELESTVSNIYINIKVITTEKINITEGTTTEFILITEAPKLVGVWGEWAQWGCLQNCSVKNLIRVRPCKDPPEGPKYFDCPGFAFELGPQTACNFLCASTCPDGHWGFNCTKTCPNCATPCEKSTGSCLTCKPGYQYPQSACTQPCKEFTYGKECSNDCMKLCQGQDCLDRVIGTCPEVKFKRIYLLLLLIIPLIGLLCWFSGRRSLEQQTVVGEASGFTELVSGKSKSSSGERSISKSAAKQMSTHSFVGSYSNKSANEPEETEV